MDIRPSEYSRSSPSKKIPNWHLAKEFVSTSSTLPTFSQNSTSQLPHMCTSEFSDDHIHHSLSAEFDQYSINSLPYLCLTKDGSIRAQQFISKSRPDQLSHLIAQIQPTLYELTIDQYANYAIQTLFQSCSASQRLSLLCTLEPRLAEVACHQKGTHTLQSMISLCSSNQEEAVYARAFNGKVLQLSFHPNASHVIQKLLGTIKNRHFLIRELIGHSRQLAADKLGLCVIKKAINDPQIFSELCENILVLMQDPYGNYAIQILVETWMEELSFSIICAIRGKVAQLCNQKYASNVIEKCLKEENMRQFIIDELINNDKIKVILSSPYGCYVLRTAVKCVDEPTKERLKPFVLQAMNSTPYKALKNRWDDILWYFE